MGCRLHCQCTAAPLTVYAAPVVLSVSLARRAAGRNLSQAAFGAPQYMLVLCVYLPVHLSVHPLGSVVASGVGGVECRRQRAGAPCPAAGGGRSRVQRCVGFPSLKNVDDVSCIRLLLRVLIVLI